MLLSFLSFLSFEEDDSDGGEDGRETRDGDTDPFAGGVGAGGEGKCFSPVFPLVLEGKDVGDPT